MGKIQMLDTILTRLKKQGISARQVALSLGYDPAHLYRVRTGRKALTVKMAAEIANRYRLSTSERLQLFQEVTSFYGADPATMADSLSRTKVPRK